MERIIAKHWHHLPAGEAVDLLDGNPEKGLDQFKVKHLHEHRGHGSGDRRNRAYASSLVTYGQAKGIVAAGIITYMVVEFEKWLRVRSLERRTVLSTHT